LPTLYYRLNVVRIELPPLKEPREDIPLIAEIFYDRVGRRPHSGCSPLAMRLIQARRWPGNGRQLLAVLESAHINASDRRIEAQHLPQEIRGSRDVAHHESDRYRYRQQSPRDDEQNTIGTALPKTGGARSAAADQLGMCRTTLWRNMKEYGLERDDDN
jgi:two-component system response regulator HydG